MATIDREIRELLHRLPELQQQRVLEFARELAHEKPHGVPGADLIAFGGRIPPDDLRLMEEAIEEGCEAVNLGEWQLSPRHEYRHRPPRQRSCR